MTRRRFPYVATVLALLSLVALLVVIGNHQYDLKTTTITFSLPNSDEKIVGTLATPPDRKIIGLVAFVHGDGPVNADHHREYLPMWERLAAEGIATVSVDKPGVDRSDGNWLHQTMSQRADETVHAIKAARRELNEPNLPVGLIGFSQAGWVMPLVASQIPIRFMIAGSPAINWIDQGRYITTQQLDDADASSVLRTNVLAANDEGIRNLDHGASHADYERWRLNLPPDVREYFSPMTADRWAFVQRNYRSDATSGLQSMPKNPVLLLLAGHDKNVNVTTTESTYRRLLPTECLTINHYPGAGHALAKNHGWGVYLWWAMNPRWVFAPSLIDDIAHFAAKNVVSTRSCR